MAATTTPRAFAQQVVETLQRAGYIAYWAGGCVRDQLLGLEPKDYDVATNATPSQICALFPRRNEIGASFGVVQVIGPRGPDGQWLTVEVATFRSDLGYSDGRRPDAVVFATPEEDARRRDFTINGMFFDPVRHLLIDYVGGQADLQTKTLRAIGDPYQRFAEDKLRILRAVRLAARFELTVDPATLQAAQQMAPQITIVAAERIADELRKIFADPHRGRGLRLLQEFQLLGPLFPELVQSFAARHPADAVHATNWEHTVAVVDLLPATASFCLAFAAVLHRACEPAFDQTPSAPADTNITSTRPADIPNQPLCPSIRPVDTSGRATPPGVANVQADRATLIGKRLRLSNAETQQIAWLVRHHTSLMQARTAPPHCWRPLLAHPAAPELVQLHRAIAEADRLPSLEDVAYCEHLLRTLSPAELNPPPLVTGSDLLNLGLPPGPEIRRLLEQVRQLQWDGVLKSKEEALAWVQQQLKGNRPAAS